MIASFGLLLAVGCGLGYHRFDTAGRDARINTQVLAVAIDKAVSQER